MNSKSREWFDLAYSFVQGTLPFGFLTGPVDSSGILRILPGASSSEAREIAQRCSAFYALLPSEEDFQEEKTRIGKEIIRGLIELFPKAHTAVEWGRLRGDLDIGLISDHYNSEEIRRILRSSREFRRRYSLLDFDSLVYFVSSTGKEIARKLRESRFESEETRCLNDLQMRYLSHTLQRTQLLWGNPNELAGMRQTLTEFSGNGHSQEKSNTLKTPNTTPSYGSKD